MIQMLVHHLRPFLRLELRDSACGYGCILRGTAVTTGQSTSTAVLVRFPSRSPSPVPSCGRIEPSDVWLRPANAHTFLLESNVVISPISQPLPSNPRRTGVYALPQTVRTL